MKTLKEKQSSVFNSLKDAFGYKNAMSAPRITKVIVSSSFGSRRSDKERSKTIEDRLTKITGQKPSVRQAKKSIATFKLREGEPLGYVVTLRGERMNKFLDKFINIAVPRTRDFRGFQRSAIDDMGNYTIGIKEHTIFPETSDEELKNVFGMAITIVTTAKTKEETEKFLECIGIPFKKAEIK